MSIPTETSVDKRWKVITKFLRKLDTCTDDSFRNVVTSIDNNIAIQKTLYARSVECSGKFLATQEDIHSIDADNYYTQANILDTTIADQIMQAVKIIQTKDLVDLNNKAKLLDISCALMDLQSAGEKYLASIRDPERGLNDLNDIIFHSARVTMIMVHLDTLGDSFLQN